MEISANRLNGALEGGSVTTLFDRRDLPIELQILDSLINQSRRIIRTINGVSPHSDVLLMCAGSGQVTSDCRIETEEAPVDLAWILGPIVDA